MSRLHALAVHARPSKSHSRMTLTPTSSAELVDVDVFTANVLKHENQIYRFCLRMLNHRDDALDAAQEVFVHALEHKDSFRGESQLKTWLLTIAKNHCFNRLKSSRKRFRFWAPLFDTSTDEPIDAPDTAEKNAEEHAIQSEDTQVILNALKTLDEDSRALIVLRDIEELSYEEVAEVSNLALGTVKSRLHRARAKLAKVCQQHISDEASRLKEHL